MSKFFYRIEHKEKKIGVYNCPVDYNNAEIPFVSVMRYEIGKNFCDDYHMSPRQNGLGKYTRIDNSRYGFASLIKLKKWFGTESNTYEVFAAYGFVLRRYKVKDRFDSDRQSVAMLPEMVFSGEISFDKIIKNH